jgi:mannobiose 2-epimerase
MLIKSRIAKFTTCICLLAFAGLQGSLQEESELLKDASRCRSILKTSLSNFYLPGALDRAGGYLENWRDGRFVLSGEKFLVMQARQLWFFSTLAIEGIETEAALAAAKSGFNFLENRMRDRSYGGYFCKVNDRGLPKDRRKHVYLNAFALYGLVAYYEATKYPKALAAAIDLFHVLEKKACDLRYGGYLEFFSEDWQPITDPKVDSPVGPGNIKTHNTHLHVLEALTELYRIWPDPALKNRLSEMLYINSSIIRHPAFPCNINEWTIDWKMIETPENFEVHYGHELEFSWLALQAARALGLSLEPYYAQAELLCNNSIKYGYDENFGGFYYAGPPGLAAVDTRKEWWVQAEALVAMLELYRFTGKEEYYIAFRQTLRFIEKYQLAPGGGWWATCTSDGSPCTSQRSAPWQGAYHNGRALLRSAKILEELASSGSIIP